MPRGKPVGAKLEAFIRSKLDARVPRDTIVPDAVTKFGCVPFTAERVLAKLDPRPPGRPKTKAKDPSIPPDPTMADSPRSRFVRRVSTIAGDAYDKLVSSVTSHLEDAIVRAARHAMDVMDGAMVSIGDVAEVESVVSSSSIARAASAPNSTPHVNHNHSSRELRSYRGPHDEPPPRLDRLGSEEAVASGRAPELGMRTRGSVVAAARERGDHHKAHALNKFKYDTLDFWDFEKAIRIKAPHQALPVVRGVIGSGLLSPKLDGALPMVRSTFIF